jgi:predicted ester cyclase
VAVSPDQELRSTGGRRPPAALPRRAAPGRRSTALLLTLGIALATALALLGTAAALSQPPVAVPHEASHREAVARFYVAVNLVLRTGDASVLAGVVVPGLVTHDARSGVDEDLTAFARHLAALRVADPSLQLAVEEVLLDGDRAAVRLRVHSRRTGTFLGLPLDGRGAPWPAIDLLRLAAGKVAERWAVGDPGVVLQPGVHARIDSGSNGVGVLGLARFRFAPGAGAANVIDAAPVLIAVEAGTLRVRIAEPAQRPDADRLIERSARPADHVLAPGDAVVVAGRARFELRNEAATLAVALVVAPSDDLARAGAVLQGGRVSGPARGRPGWPAGLTVATLAVAPAGALPPGPVAVAIGRATLGPRASLPPHAVAGVEFLAVASGRLGLVAMGLPAIVDQGDGLAPSPSGSAGGGPQSEVGLTPGDAVALSGGAVAALRNVGTGPLVVWVVTISPAGQGLAPSAPVPPSASKG